MPGYSNRTVRHDYPDYGHDVWIVLRNPQMVPAKMLTPPHVPTGPDGAPLDEDAALAGVHEVIARLVIDWHVYDASVDEDDQPLLGPPSRDTVANLPVGIFKHVSEWVGSVMSPT